MNMLHTFSGVDASGDIELKERLIATVKKEVKQLMEEAVTKKYIHEESSSVTSLCAAVEACISHGLRRRALGLFKTSSTTALIQKIAKNCPEADYISRRLLEIELANESSSSTVAGKRSCSSSDSIIKPKLLSKGSSISVTTINTVSAGTAVSSPSGVKYLWIRLALYEKRLAKIIEHLVGNANNYYDRDAVVADSDYGSILSSLLVGPCALDYTRVRAADFYDSDPHADELVQRHRISSGNRTPPTCHRPIINFKRSLHASSEDTSSGSFKASSPASVAKDYVESLHQNSKTTLLYGKNNVLVLPKGASEAMPGYLSLHQTVQSLTIKWTPNQLMNGYNGADGLDKSFYWALALNIQVDEIVYVHCHQNRGEDTGGTIILVGQDGVQQPPIHFPEGGHMQAFLSCLETGLLPHGQLDPPLWSNRGIGKMFPWPKSVRRRILPSVMESTDETPIDYVFRVVRKSLHEDFLATHHILELGPCSPRRQHLGSCSTTGSSDCSSKSLSIDHCPLEATLIKGGQTTSIELLCSTMRKQIISRAFYGWLAYCRHLSTVRTHLSGLVNGRITPDLAADEEGLTKAKWEALHVQGVIENELEVYRLVYFGGVQHEIRREVWPYLLGHYSFCSTLEERMAHDDSCQHYYETTMSEWLAVEAIVRQREKEKMAQAVAKLSAENASCYAGQKRGEQKYETNDEQLENDVFDVNDFSDISDANDDEEYFEENFTGKRKTTEYKEDRNEVESIRYDDDDDEAIIETVKSEHDLHDDEFMEKEDVLQCMQEQSEQVIVEFENIGDEDEMERLQLQENCLADIEMDAFSSVEPAARMLAPSIRSSPSTSSYETVGNEFVDMMDFNAMGVGVGVGEVMITDEAVEKASEHFDTCRKSASSDEIENSVQGKILQFQNIEDIDQGKIDGDEEEEEDETVTTTHASVIVTEVSADMDLHVVCEENHLDETSRKTSLMSPLQEDVPTMTSLDALREPKSACVSPASSNGGVYSCELLEKFALNLHRIEKDVQRCDRNYWYFANENLDKLRNVISTYVWQNLEVGYMQGMCDLVAPLLVIFDDESMCYSCFCKLMGRMIENFPNGGAMDMHFANMRNLIQILDSEMYDLMDSHGDYTHFYFCYRWFLLDFKREFLYDDVFANWEVIWAAKHVASGHFVLFLALALLETYREIILSNSMDFTDVIKFFNEMAERHNAHSILKLSRSLVLQLQTIIENK